MESKKILQTLCFQLETDLNERDGTFGLERVKLYSGTKDITTQGDLNEVWGRVIVKKQPSWIVEIIVDNDVVFRGSYIPRVEEDLKEVEELVATRVLRHAFTFGVMSSKQYIEKIKQEG